MEDFEINYNSQLDHMVNSEYGRHVQNLIKHAKTIEDKEYKQKFVTRIVNLMYQMNPRSKNILEYKESIWKDVFKIADYDLDGVVPPNGEIPKPEEDQIKPDRLEYPVSEKKFRHYGHNVQSMIKKAVAMEDEDKKVAYTAFIASYMKLAYRTWNKEHYVNDNVIKEDLMMLSNNQLTIKEGVLIENLVAPSSTKRRTSNNYRNNNRNNNSRYKKNNNSKYRRKK